MFYASKKLQKTSLYNDYKNLEDFYYKTSLNKEFKQQDYLKNFLFTNEKTGECFNLNYNFEKYYNNYSNTLKQKLMCIEQKATDEGLIPLFITLTLPSNYHPFSSIKYKNKRLYNRINSNFDFDNIEESIFNGYTLLNKVFRTFYKRVKNISKKLYFIKVFEIHKTFIPHLHIIFYIKNEVEIKETKIKKSKRIKILNKNVDTIEKIRKIYDKITTEFKLNQTDFDLVHLNKKELKNNGVKTGIYRASKYLLKYVLKQLKDGSDYFHARILDGWKRVHKIKIITSSNLELSLSDYRNIYYNIGKEEKEKLLEKAKVENKSIFYYILKNISIITVVITNKQSLIKKFLINKNSSIILLKNITKNPFNGAYHSSVDKLEIYINKKLVYEKEKYIKIKI
jgi:hypothetical protein